LAFVTLMSLLGGTALGMALARGWIDGAVALTVWGAFTILVGTGGFLAPRVVGAIYRAWNDLTHLYMRIARFLLKHVCFWIIVTPLGLTGGGLVLSRRTTRGTMWVPHTTIRPAAYESQDDLGGTRRGAGWIGSYLSWAARLENMWAIFLLPFLIMLGPLERDDATNTVPSQTYTLF
jgi:hypothetical protein